MASSILARLRGPDGRSLMRALAFLLFLNAFLGGFHAAIAVAAESGATTIHCTTDGSGGHGSGPAIPAAQRDCCLTGCSVAPAGLPSAGASVLLLPRAIEDRFPPHMTRLAFLRLPRAHEAPRGPPLLA